jgi:hypothetical protein
MRYPYQSTGGRPYLHSILVALVLAVLLAGFFAAREAWPAELTEVGRMVARGGEKPEPLCPVGEMNIPMKDCTLSYCHNASQLSNLLLGLSGQVTAKAEKPEPCMVAAYKASDGKLFESREEMEGHEKTIKWEKLYRHSNGIRGCFFTTFSPPELKRLRCFVESNWPEIKKIMEAP